MKALTATETTEITAAGDPFVGAPHKDDCFWFAGCVTLALEEDGEEINEAVPCRRSNDPKLDIILLTRGGSA